MLRPFKVGDYVLAGDVEGTVRAIGLFTTSIDTPDNVLTSVGNAKVMGGTIKNFSHNPYRRVDLTAQLDHTVDPHDAIRRLKDALPKIANVVPEPKPDVEILTFNERGPVLAVRPYVQHRPLLAGLLRHQQGDPRHLRRRRLPGAGIARPHAATRGLNAGRGRRLDGRARPAQGWVPDQRSNRQRGERWACSTDFSAA